MTLNIQSLQECETFYKKVQHLTDEAFTFEREGNKGTAFHKYVSAFSISKAIANFLYGTHHEPIRSMVIQSTMHLSPSANAIGEGLDFAEKLIESSKYNDMKQDAFKFLEKHKFLYKNAC